MNTIQLKLNDQKRGAFVIEAGDERLAEMVVAIMDHRLVVYHTEVSEKMHKSAIVSLNMMDRGSGNYPFQFCSQMSLY